MAINWLTALIALVFVWSLLQGLGRGFAWQLGYVVAKLVSFAAGIAAFYLAWYGSNHLGQWTAAHSAGTASTLLQQVVQAWQKAPNLARIVAFLVVYLLVSSILNQLFRPVPVALERAVPGLLRRNRLLGGALGGVVGVARALLVGGLVFVVTKYYSFPYVAAQAQSSKPYQYMAQNVYEPWLNPLVNKELPVLAKGALQPLSQNINLFVIPSGGGKETGILVVPKPIAQLSAQITAGKTTPRAKAYALYEWEIHHIHYNWAKYNDYVYHGKWDQQSPMQTLKTGEGVCADYALLYADLAHAAGLTVQIDEGLGGVGGNLGSHAWNKVWDSVSNRWITVDTTWGAEQDAWFDAPHFNQTHIQQTAIVIPGGRG
ncbi:transglutaminase domain-containing protein [Alicyclobacillus tolerans]|uniref:transglutaminase domain-containing protein n=1 Tax=Alicyclobacillus tolerans TaxID=90970 RepID=UPI001F41CE4B|nr:transglutaminase domain-containing protein [Alicyclobacillus tolerans]MCF8563313.1 transglutaminase domain-containing protein [Alicyclobacillus tolerans]